MKKVILITAANRRGAQLARALERAGHIALAGDLDVSSQPAVDGAIRAIVAERGGIDVVIHIAGPVVSGTAQGSTPEGAAEHHGADAVGVERVNRAVLPHLRARDEALVVWVSSSSALAMSYTGELARSGIETAVVVAAASGSATDPVDTAVADAIVRLVEMPFATRPSRTHIAAPSARRFRFRLASARRASG